MALEFNPTQPNQITMLEKALAGAIRLRLENNYHKKDEEFFLWSLDILDTLAVYVRRFDNSGVAINPLDRTMTIGWKFYTNPLEARMPHYPPNTLQLGGYVKRNDIELIEFEDTIKMWNDVEDQVIEGLKWTLRVMRQRQRRGFEPWIGRGAGQRVGRKLP